MERIFAMLSKPEMSLHLPSFILSPEFLLLDFWQITSAFQVLGIDLSSAAGSPG